MEAVQHLSANLLTARKELKRAVTHTKESAPMNIFQWHATFMRAAKEWDSMDPQERQSLRAIVRYFYTVFAKYKGLPWWSALRHPSFLWSVVEMRLMAYSTKPICRAMADEDRKARSAWALIESKNPTFAKTARERTRKTFDATNAIDATESDWNLSHHTP